MPGIVNMLPTALRVLACRHNVITWQDTFPIDEENVSSISIVYSLGYSIVRIAFILSKIS